MEDLHGRVGRSFRAEAALDGGRGVRSPAPLDVRATVPELLETARVDLVVSEAGRVAGKTARRIRAVRQGWKGFVRRGAVEDDFAATSPAVVAVPVAGIGTRPRKFAAGFLALSAVVDAEGARVVGGRLVAAAAAAADARGVAAVVAAVGGVVCGLVAVQRKVGSDACTYFRVRCWRK